MSSNKHAHRSPSFLRFGIKRLLLLFVVLGVLGALVGPKLRSAYRARQTKQRTRLREQAITELNRAIQNDDTAAAIVALEVAIRTKLTLGNKVGLSFLWKSIGNGQLEITEALLEQGADPNYHEYIADDTALFAAIKSKHPKTTLRPGVPLDVRLKMIELLIEHGADPLQSVGGTDSMGLAVQMREPEVAKLLHQHGVPYGPREMAAFGQLDELKQLIAKDPDLVHQRLVPSYKTKPGWEPTLLSMAIERDHREMAIYLIEQGVSVNTMQYGTSGLHVAGGRGDVELVRMLLARGADVNAIDAYDSTPLIHCAQQEVSEVMALLIEAGADLGHQSKTTRGWTALHAAAKTGDADTIRLLLEAGANPTIKDNDGKRPADLAEGTIVELLNRSDEQQTQP